MSLRKIEKIGKNIEKLKTKIAVVELKTEELAKKCDVGKITKAEREKKKRALIAKAGILRSKIRHHERIRLYYEKKLKEKEEEKKKKK